MIATDKQFEAGARAIATANRIPIETARIYLSFIGDTPELSGDDGLTIVRDDDDQEIARIVLPCSE